ncbi:M24 family metallopeptidase [Deinococcus maricopensis]|uniref:Peptidase M24 n=1 Tax=Deinococcus maricopensis (strain DSM 21211 / LMG 22137 / NRRL B-23946 / LB-34) TaxID=709986 RepID=E8U2Y7_DEIML|nr:M24 family metallopeptidase [Deinococcus maricopensis]ADV65725.1 peptidase M24 [Deinococcus maricopensis DSM 21211]
MQVYLDRIRDALRATDLDGWLIYDFQGLNPHARTVLGIPERAHLTRRFFVYVPREGTPTLIHHRIEGGTWRTLAGSATLTWQPYSAHTELDAHLHALLAGQRVAMEYSARGAVPYVSRVDAGTLERVREAGADVHSSADLLQQFLVWTPEDEAAHARAVDVLMRAKDDAFRYVHDQLQQGEPVTELDVQAVIARVIEDAGMSSGHAVMVGFGVNAADPHYEPGGDKNATLSAGQAVMLDLWCQEDGRPFADVTWMGFAGTPTPDFLEVWQAVADARDAGIAVLQDRTATTQGWEADRAAREVLAARGLAEHFTHRLGHNLGVQLHGPGANLDDLETHDTRTLLGGLAVTVEPGVYDAARGFGIRSEVNLYLTPNGGARLTTPVQAAPFALGEGDWASVRARALGEA